jgi:uncharacterized protein with NAD-binding domain and iron-sulfur cluster
VPNLFLAGDYTQQEFMASIEGATRSAIRCVERIDQQRAGARHAAAPEQATAPQIALV